MLRSMLRSLVLAGTFLLAASGCATSELGPLIEALLASTGTDQTGQAARGADGVSCWDLNRDGVGQVSEDVNGDGAFNALDCQGGDGVSCWDLNGNGVGEPAEDTNGDGNFTAADCIGPRGATGAQGAQGAPGAPGAQGAQGQQGAAGQQGQQGLAGAAGLACWDLNGDGLAELATEDTNGDNNIDVLDCRGATGDTGDTGAQGPAGTSCWDVNGDGFAQPEEDINEDGAFDALDCRGAQGPQGTQGDPGAQGDQGPQGEQGPPGQDATFPDGFSLISRSPVPPAGFEFAGVSLAAGDHWDYKTNYQGEVSGLMVAASDGMVYVMGGEDWNGFSLSANWAYDTQSGWFERASLPAPREYGVAIALDGKIYLIGGYSDTTGGWGFRLEVDVYDVASDTWDSAAPLPAERNGFAAGAIGGKIYVAGGFGNVSPTSGLVYDPALDQWTPIADMPTNRQEGGCAVAGDKLYVFGGYEWSPATGGPGFTTTSVYDPATDSWDVEAPLNQWRERPAGASANGRVYAIGGELGGIAAGNGGGIPFISATASVEEYDPITGFWAVRASLPQPRQDAVAATWDGRIYIVGGGYYYWNNDGEWYSLYEIYAMTPPTILYVHMKVDG